MIYDVAIVIVNYKTFDLTKNCIDSIISKSKGFSYEIIVVDNSNSKEEFELLTTLQNDTVKVIDAKENLGFGKANNLGVKYSNAKYIHFLNSDTILINNAIYKLFANINSIEDCGIVGSNLFDKNNNPTSCLSLKKHSVKTIKKENSFSSLVKRNILNKRDDFNFKGNKALSICGVSGASLMISKEDFDSLGGFDERIFMYAEDSLMCEQMKSKLNKNIYNIPTSKIIHLEGGSDSKVYSDFKIKNFIKGNYIFFQTAYNKEEADKMLLTFRKVFNKKYKLAKLMKKEVVMKNSQLYVNEIDRIINGGIL